MTEAVKKKYRAKRINVATSQGEAQSLALAFAQLAGKPKVTKKDVKEIRDSIAALASTGTGKKLAKTKIHFPALTVSPETKQLQISFVYSHADGDQVHTLALKVE